MKKRTIVIILIILVMLLGIGYAAFQTQLKITGTGKIDSSWNVFFEGIYFGGKSGDATEASEPTFTDTSATFNVNLKKPGDSYFYVIVVRNSGTINAKIEDVTVAKTGDAAVTYALGSDAVKGKKIAAGGAIPITVTLKFDSSATSIPTNKVANVKVDIKCVQDD